MIVPCWAFLRVFWFLHHDKKFLQKQKHAYTGLNLPAFLINFDELSKFIIEICALKRMKDETVYKKHGKYSLQDAGEDGVGKAWT